MNGFSCLYLMLDMRISLVAPPIIVVIIKRGIH